jgi:hypothetical protein
MEKFVLEDNFRAFLNVYELECSLLSGYVNLNSE